jgi:hypothetical protein
MITPPTLAAAAASALAEFVEGMPALGQAGAPPSLFNPSKPEDLLTIPPLRSWGEFIRTIRAPVLAPAASVLTPCIPPNFPWGNENSNLGVTAPN